MGGPYRGKLVGVGESTSSKGWKRTWKSRTEVGRQMETWLVAGKERPHEHLVRTDDRVVNAQSVRRLAENSWSEENLKSIIETTEAEVNDNR